MRSIQIMVALAVLCAVMCGCAMPDVTGYEWAQFTDSGPFTIGADDTLKIDFWNQKDLSREVIVRPDGFIDLPLIGEVEVGGLTPQKAGEAIAEKLRQFEKNPVVTVAFRSIKSYRVYVMGRVQKPGEFQLSHKITVLQALSLAGGLTPFADGNRTIIVRKAGEEELQIPFVYDMVIEGKMPAMNIVLATGDTVVVP